MLAIPSKPYWGGGWVDHHQACVRMVRADYCGDGRSWTVNGRRVNLYDDWWAQQDTMAWNLEAEWTPSGAYCILKRRVVTPNAPTCARERQSPGNDCCTYDPSYPFRSGTLILSEFQTQLVQ
jgi:hypothetical protein